jgi:hypothetical protein
MDKNTLPSLVPEEALNTIRELREYVARLEQLSKNMKAEVSAHASIWMPVQERGGT